MNQSISDKPTNYLQAAYAALTHEGNPLTSRELTKVITDNKIFPLEGKTPWKTLNARISAEIIENGSNSLFIRVDRGQFALRQWSHAREYVVKKRKINPIEEDIAVVRRREFLALLKNRHTADTYTIDYVSLCSLSQSLLRADAELTDEFVQLIPLFYVRHSEGFLTYKRTKWLPEKRLHGTRSINFGGHLQVNDFPYLFQNDISIVDHFMQRELREELNFSPDQKEANFKFAIHQDSTLFGRQHVGLVFEVVIDNSTIVTSNEPGFLTSIEFMSKSEIISRDNEFDDWTQIVLSEEN